MGEGLPQMLRFLEFFLVYRRQRPTIGSAVIMEVGSMGSLWFPQDLFRNYGHFSEP